MTKYYKIKSLNLELSFEWVMGLGIAWKKQTTGVSIVVIIPFVVIQYN